MRQNNNQPGQIFLSLDQLSQYDGREGSPAYIAVNGIIYDVSDRPQWSMGVHFGVSAGKDVSQRLQLCHGGQILDSLPVVGRII